MRTCHDSELAFVVQGPVVDNATVSTRQVCASIRQHFPQAEIVLSTWQGSDVAGMEVDQVVLSADPGPLCDRDANLNRLLVSSLAGIRQATRPLVMKTRADLFFTSDSVLDYWDRWTDFSPELRLFRKRVLVPNTFTFKPTYVNCHAFHPSDWCFLGLKEDLEFLFDIPLCGVEDLLVETPIDVITPWIWKEPYALRLVNEQYLWLKALQKRFPELAAQTFVHLTPQNHRQTELACANNLVVLDAGAQYGIFMPKYPDAETRFGANNLIRHKDWSALYAAYCAPLPAALPPCTFEDVRAAAGDLRGWTEDDPRLVALRRAGHSWEAMLIDCALRAPADLRRRSARNLPGIEPPLSGPEMIPLWAQAQLTARLAEPSSQLPSICLANDSKSFRPMPAGGLPCIQSCSENSHIDPNSPPLPPKFGGQGGELAQAFSCSQVNPVHVVYPLQRLQNWQTSPPLTTVCMPLQRVEDLTAECLQRLSTQTGLDTHVVIVLNGAPDPVPAWLMACVEASSRFLLVRTAQPIPAAALWNHCLQTFAGVYLVALGPNDMLAATCIHRLVSVMSTYPNIPVGRTALVEDLPHGGRQFIPMRAEDAILGTLDAAVACLTHPAFTRSPSVQIFRRSLVLSEPTLCDPRFDHCALDELTLRLAVRSGLAYLARRSGSRPYAADRDTGRKRTERYREECALRIHALRELGHEGAIAYNRDFVEMVNQRLNLLYLVDFSQSQEDHERATLAAIYRNAVQELRRLVDDMNATKHLEAMDCHAQGAVARAIALLQDLLHESPYYGPAHAAMSALLSASDSPVQAHVHSRIATALRAIPFKQLTNAE